MNDTVWGKTGLANAIHRIKVAATESGNRASILVMASSSSYRVRSSRSARSERIRRSGGFPYLPTGATSAKDGSVRIQEKAVE